MRIIQYNVLAIALAAFISTSVSAITVDGTAEADYGAAVATQLVGTGFGDATSGSVSNANGSELDAGYGTIIGDVMYLVLAGNLEANFNKLEVFIDSVPGGQNKLLGNNADVDFNRLNRMGDDGGGTNGLVFDADFSPDYWIGVTGGGGPYTLFANYAPLATGGGDTNGYFLGSTSAVTDGTLGGGGNNPAGIRITINNSNTNGVIGGACDTSGAALNPGLVRTGIELAIPLAVLGSPTGVVKVCAFVNGSGHDFLSNQILGPGSTNGVPSCLDNLGEPRSVNFTNLVGSQYFSIGPAVRVTNVARSGNNINVSWQTSAISNLTYQLQRTSVLTTNPTYTNVGSPTNGTGAVITQTDTGGATNTPGQFYRVRQTGP